MAERTHSKDGRLRIDPPCELGHRWQATECPSCAERTTGKKSSPEWWTWYRRRYQKSKKSKSQPHPKGERVAGDSDA